MLELVGDTKFLNHGATDFNIRTHDGSTWQAVRDLKAGVAYMYGCLFL